MLIIILLIGLTLRLIAINQSLWLDEAVQVWASSNFSIKDLLAQYMPGDFNPPLYHIVLHNWIKLFGSSEIAIRLPSVIFSLISIFLIYKIGGKFSALLLATAPLHIYYSQEARMYMLASMAVLLAFYFRKKPILFSLSLLAMGFSHFLTLFTLPIFIFDSLKNKRPLWPYFILLVGYLAYSPILVKQLTTGSQWIKDFPVWKQTVGSFSSKAAVLLPAKFIIGRITLANKLIYGLGSAILVTLYWGIILKSLKPKVKSGDHLISYFLFLPPVLGFLISFWLPVFSYFRFLFVLPFFYLAIAESVKNNRLLKIIFLTLNLIFSLVYLLNQNFHRENWREAVSWLKDNNTINAPVMILSQISKPFEYYDKNTSPIYDDSNHRNSSKEIFLVTYGLPIFDPEDKIREELRIKNLELKIKQNFRGVGVERWTEQE